MSDYLEDHAKMNVLRKMAKERYNVQLAYIIKILDETWDEEIAKLQPIKKTAFITKF